MEPLSFLEQIERLRQQNKDETDPVLKDENLRTIAHLHEQYRKATTYRPVGLCFALLAAFLFTLFFLAMWASLRLEKQYGWATIGAAVLASVLFVLATVTTFLVLRLISQEVYQSLVEKSLDTIAKLLPQK